ncbi:hypothetical protein [Streptomyces abyssalis]|uniref:hypothetical protein n=1 Tax=Streptomyces abyssalis TaxID=933944 RepID=UPI000ADF1A05|nr:hypothetical protein [Streptomyces abyssalis]
MGAEVPLAQGEPDDPDDEECSSATGSTVLRCELPKSPSADEIADLLNQLEGDPALLAKCAETKVGSALAGTGFVVPRTTSAELRGCEWLRLDLRVRHAECVSDA